MVSLISMKSQIKEKLKKILNSPEGYVYESIETKIERILKSKELYVYENIETLYEKLENLCEQSDRGKTQTGKLQRIERKHLPTIKSELFSEIELGLYSSPI